LTQLPHQQQRIGFVDLLRGWAVVFMIETHVFNALLLPAFRKETFFVNLTFINGLVAPSFTFCAGFALAITLQRKWDDYINLQYPFWRYLLRLFFILVVAYTLHLPSFSLTTMLHPERMHNWQSFFQSDILHVISLTLLAAVLLVIIVRKRIVYDYAIGVIALFLIFFAPFFREMNFQELPIWVRPYLSAHYKSQFPVFPWSAFLLSGVLIGSWILKHLNDPKKIRMYVMVAALATVLISIGVEALPFYLYPNHSFWSASPEFFFVRLGLVCFLLASCWFIEYVPAGIFRKAIALFGTESLLVYVVHLLIVYGHSYQWSLIRAYGKTFNYFECFVTTVALIVAMYFMALGWSYLKRWDKRVALVLQYVVLGVIALKFIIE